jgi:hypothetical protein
MVPPTSIHPFTPGTTWSAVWASQRAAVENPAVENPSMGSNGMCMMSLLVLEDQ